MCECGFNLVQVIEEKDEGLSPGELLGIKLEIELPANVIADRK